MKEKPASEFEQFDKIMAGLLAVPYAELQEKLAEEKQAKAKTKKRATSSPASSARASSTRKKKVA